MELRSIYRTYRPQKWAEVVGQEMIVQTLMNEIAHDTLVHAYCFTGMRGVGKTTTARLLAKAVNCGKRKKGSAEPCDTCASCIAIARGRALDVVEIDAASHTGVDNVRDNIIAASRVAPLELSMKVFIIDEVHMLSTAAFNALLKTLEEPSARVLFILATTDIDRVPETIISRCQRFDFRQVNPRDMEKRLRTLAAAEKVVVDDAVLATIVRYAEGALRDAESMLGQLLSLGNKKITEEDAALILPRGDEARAEAFVGHLLRHEGKEALSLIDDFVERGGDVRVFLDDCIRSVRRMLLADIRGERKGLATREILVALLSDCVVSARDAAVMHPPSLALELLIARHAGEHNKDKESSRDSSDSVAVPIVKKQRAKDTPLSSLTLSLIMDRWKEVLACAKKYNHSLALILKVATPVAMNEDVLTLGFRYAFHADRLADIVHQKLASRVFEEVFACPLDVRTTIVHTETTVEKGEEPVHASTMVSDILHTFGGKVIQKSET